MSIAIKKSQAKTSYYISLLFLLITGMITSCTTPEASLADKKNYTEDDDQYKRKFNITFEEDEKPLRYGYHYVVSSVPHGFKVRVFHPDKKVLIEEKMYSTSALTLLHGPYKSFWDDGYIRAQGHYLFGRKHGTWLECEPGKGKSSSGAYLNDKKEGIWTQLDTSGLIENVFTWQDGQRHGKFYEYDTSGQKTNEGIYRADTLISELFKRELVQRPYMKLCQVSLPQDVYSCTESTLLQEVYTKIKYPAKARQMKIEGAAMVQWDILADGTVRNLRVPQGLCDEIEAECRRVMEDLHAWVPATKGGNPVKYTMSLPIHFKF